VTTTRDSAIAFENLAVGQALQSFVSEVGRVVSLRVQPRRNAHIHAHVIEKTHVQTLAKVNLFLGQPSGIFNRLLDIFPFQIRVALKNFLKRRSMRDLAHNYGDRYAHSAYACSPAHDLGVKGDSVKHNQSPPDFGSYPRAARRRLGYNAFMTIAKRWKFCAVIVSPGFTCLSQREYVRLCHFAERISGRVWRIDPS